jgi:hypothetical protein
VQVLVRASSNPEQVEVDEDMEHTVDIDLDSDNIFGLTLGLDVSVAFAISSDCSSFRQHIQYFIADFSFLTNLRLVLH